MLEELRITGLGVIEDTTLPLTGGMNVITGETGAGKTMVVTGLGLLFGGRADAGRVRAEPGRAVVEGRLRLGGRVAETVHARITDAGGEPDEDGCLLLSRTVTVEGRSRAHLGGRGMPVSMLGEVGEQAVAVHGQSDQLRLLRPAEQRAALDRFAGPEHEKLLDATRDAFTRWRRVVDDLADRRRNARERHQETDLLRLGLDEITRVDPQPGEDDELKAEAQRLEHAEGLRTAAQLAHQCVAGGLEATDDTPDASTLLGTARRTLEAQSGTDPALGELAVRLEEAATLVADVSVELSTYLAGLDADPARLQALYERRAALRALTRKYADDVDGVIAWAERARSRLSELDNSDELLDELDREASRLAGEVAELAGGCRCPGRRRRRASPSRSPSSWPGWRCRTPGSRWRCCPDPPVGPNPRCRSTGSTSASDPTAVTRSSCGCWPTPARRPCPCNGVPPAAPGDARHRGGLRRIRGPPTLVFDEVDAGVGGQAAVEIGRRLARLARSHQVLVVTHLPQVAAFADRHLVVAKDTGGAVTTSGVRVVEDTERARELARMLAGLPDSDLGIAHAEELLAVAARERRS